MAWDHPLCPAQAGLWCHPASLYSGRSYIAFGDDAEHPIAITPGVTVGGQHSCADVKAHHLQILDKILRDESPSGRFIFDYKAFSA